MPPFSPSIDEIQFRPMRMEDVPDLVAIDRSWEGSRWNRAAFERELNLPMSLALVADRGGAPVGFGVMWVVTETAQLLEFAVSPAHRRQGVGSGLMKSLMDAARARGCEKMELELHEGNFPAQSFYEKMGFEIKGRRRRFYDMGQGRMCDAILMERPL
ncbi:MAG: ribosomal-protein-alanine N-acetyltransferase [Elusimicrobia bacterium RIFCSPLOWO2_01_FULL_54_10]|nr:MAG: ribosomal-protein-alanine N-acetyltransferase [Elusimicrobia bacterium RIFCSPLOWO2_01_FULL_54_10]